VDLDINFHSGIGGLDRIGGEVVLNDEDSVTIGTYHCFIRNCEGRYNSWAAKQTIVNITHRRPVL